MTSSDPSSALRDLLARVAAGDLDPAEAARILDEDPMAPTVDRREIEALDPANVTSLTIHAGGVKLVVLADPSVDTAVAVGPHSVRRNGSALVIDAPRSDGYQVEPPPRLLGWIPTTWTGGRGERVTVRVNPDLPLTVDATACSVDLTGLHADLTLSGVGSSVKVRDHRGPLHGTVSMGAVSFVGAITGPSALACELGSLDLRLTAGSDVVLAATAEMGSLKVADRNGTSGGDGSARDTLTVGAGTHPFLLTVRMGSASVVAS